jgi:hypothetical protein
MKWAGTWTIDTNNNHELTRRPVFQFGRRRFTSRGDLTATAAMTSLFHRSANRGSVIAVENVSLYAQPAASGIAPVT